TLADEARIRRLAGRAKRRAEGGPLIAEKHERKGHPAGQPSRECAPAIGEHEKRDRRQREDREVITQHRHPRGRAREDRPLPRERKRREEKKRARHVREEDGGKGEEIRAEG